MARRMISLQPDDPAFDDWLAYHRGTKTELVMLACRRRGEAFKVWSREPPQRADARRVTRWAEAPAAQLPGRRVVAEGEIGAIADRLERRAAIDAEHGDAAKARHAKADKIEHARDRALRKIQMGDRPDNADKLSDYALVEAFDPTEEKEMRDGHRKVTKLATRPKLVSLRDDPIGQMAKRDQISAVQLDAARRWQALYDTAAIGGARGIDPCNIKVDGGRFAEPINDTQRAAIKRLAKLDERLGDVGKRIVRSVLGDRLTISQVAVIMGRPAHSDRERQTERERIGWRVRECLDTLIGCMGLVASGRGKAMPNDEAAAMSDYARTPALHRAVHEARRKRS